MNMITAELACRIRKDRGLTLPLNGEYSLPRLKFIAERQYALLEELDKLDKELEILKLLEIPIQGDKENYD